MFGKNLPFIGITLVVAIVLFFIGRTTSDKNPNNTSDANNIQLRESSSTNTSPQTLNPDQSTDWKSLLADKEQIQSLSSSAQFLALEEKLRAWAQEDPLAALAFAKEQVEPASEVRYLVFAILDVWVRNEPLAAWTWGEKDSDFNLHGMLNAMGEIAPELAWEKAGVFADKEEFANLENAGYVSAIQGMLHLSATMPKRSSSLRIQRSLPLSIARASAFISSKQFSPTGLSMNPRRLSLGRIHSPKKVPPTKPPLLKPSSTTGPMLTLNKCSPSPTRPATPLSPREPSQRVFSDYQNTNPKKPSLGSLKGSLNLLSMIPTKVSP